LRRSPKPGALTAAILGHDQERLARLHDRLENRQHRLQARELLLEQQDVGAVELGDHLVGVGDEVRRQVTAVELHAFDDIQLGVEALGLLDGDHALIADLLHRLGDHLADRLVAVGRDGADLGDLVGARDLLGAGLDVLDRRFDGDVDAALEVHRVHAGRDRLHALAHDRRGEHGRRRRAVAGDVVGLRGHFAHHLGAHVLELVGELDLLGDGDAVLGDARRAEALVEHDVAALRTQRHLDRVGENVDAAQHALTGIAAKADFLGCHCLTLFGWMC
jgi:hypothetical protein